MLRIELGLLVKLHRWAWLDAGPTRRCIGRDAESGEWTVTPPVLDVDLRDPAVPPRWLVTTDNGQVFLDAPGLPSSDEPLAVIDRLRRDPTSGLDAGTLLRIVPWRPAINGDGNHDVVRSLRSA